MVSCNQSYSRLLNMQSYQLHIHISDNIEIQIGKLGKFTFPMVNYIYTGSAKKNIDERIKRHQSNSSDKNFTGMSIIC